MFTPGPPVSVGGVHCRVTSLPLIGSHDVDGTFISVGDPGTAVKQHTCTEYNQCTITQVHLHAQVVQLKCPIYNQLDPKINKNIISEMKCVTRDIMCSCTISVIIEYKTN